MTKKRKPTLQSVTADFESLGYDDKGRFFLALLNGEFAFLAEEYRGLHKRLRRRKYAERDAEVVRLKESGEATKTIARQLGIKPANVRAILSRARKAGRV